jgi:alkenylglycerophosphocholine/alkenylglycerophosphoethanolamine hydrolase
MDILLQNSGLAFAAALFVAVLDWLAVHHEQRRAEYVFKPATLVIVVVAAWLITRGPHDVWMARFFLPGLVFSLAGDVFLMLPGERFFVPGLASFLLAHICYVVGLNPALPPLPALIPLAAIAVLGALLFRGIASGLRKREQAALLVPVAVYSLALSLMLFSAWATLFRPEWTPLRRALVIAGASLFFASDSMLAWDKFVQLLPGGHTKVMITYHLAQLSLAAAIALM